MRYRKKNRSGNCVALACFKAHDCLVSEYGDTLPNAVRANLEALVEIRDNAMHFLNAGSRPCDGDPRDQEQQPSRTTLRPSVSGLALISRGTRSPSAARLPWHAQAGGGVTLNVEERHTLQVPHEQHVRDRAYGDPSDDFNVALTMRSPRSPISGYTAIPIVQVPTEGALTINAVGMRKTSAVPAPRGSMTFPHRAAPAPLLRLLRANKKYHGLPGLLRRTPAPGAASGSQKSRRTGTKFNLTPTSQRSSTRPISAASRNPSPPFRPYRRQLGKQVESRSWLAVVAEAECLLVPDFISRSCAVPRCCPLCCPSGARRCPGWTASRVNGIEGQRKIGVKSATFGDHAGSAPQHPQQLPELRRPQRNGAGAALIEGRLLRCWGCRVAGINSRQKRASFARGLRGRGAFCCTIR